MTFYPKTHEELLESGRLRMEKYVDRREPYQCWPWTGTLFREGGYGQIKIARRSCRAHVVALELASGEAVPQGMCVLHTCDNRLCCNPAHLYVGTHQQNMADRDRRFRHQHRESHWKAKLTERDVYLIREKWASGIPGTELARQYGVGQSAISMIVRGLHWTPDRPFVRAA